MQTTTKYDDALARDPLPKILRQLYVYVIFCLYFVIVQIVDL